MSPVSGLLEASNAGHSNPAPMMRRWLHGATPRVLREVIFGIGINQLSEWCARWPPMAAEAHGLQGSSAPRWRAVGAPLAEDCALHGNGVRLGPSVPSSHPSVSQGCTSTGSAPLGHPSLTPHAVPHRRYKHAHAPRPHAFVLMRLPAREPFFAQTAGARSVCRRQSSMGRRAATSWAR